jgi:hypothetical protein
MEEGVVVIKQSTRKHEIICSTSSYAQIFRDIILPKMLDDAVTSLVDSSTYQNTPLNEWKNK